MDNIKISENVQNAYNEQYNDNIAEWRRIGAKYKFKNIIDVCNGKEFEKILEFGAGEGSILQFIDSSHLAKKLYALEISDSGIEQIRNKKITKLVEAVKFDGYHTKYDNNEFDLVYCSHVIEHVEHPRLVLREIKRISKHQVFEIPLDYSKDVDKKLKHFLSYGHINIYTPSLFKFLLKSEGFNIINEVYTNIDKEAHQFQISQNNGNKNSLKIELLSRLLANKGKIMKLLRGKKWAQEFSYSAYTCFTEADKEINIF